jgi:hypothetical protein
MRTNGKGQPEGVGPLTLDEMDYLAKLCTRFALNDADSHALAVKANMVRDGVSRVRAERNGRTLYDVVFRVNGGEDQVAQCATHEGYSRACETDFREMLRNVLPGGREKRIVVVSWERLGKNGEQS